MRLLKIVAIPAAIALLMTPADASEASVRSKILGKIQKANTALAQKTESVECVDCDTPCHLKHKETNGECPDGAQYHPEDFKDREHLYHFEKIHVEVDIEGITDPFNILNGGGVQSDYPTDVVE